MLQLRNKRSDKGPLWLVESKYSLGSDALCDIKVSGTAHAHIADILVDGDKVSVVNVKGNGDLLLNKSQVKGAAQVHPGDVLSVGDVEFEVIDPKSARKKAPAVKPEVVSRWSLKALNTGLADKNFPITDSKVIGRSKDCDISLGVVHLSRQHARFTVTDRGLQIEDLNSSNGTFVNGKKVTNSVIFAGDELSFDTLKFMVIGPPVDEDRTYVRAKGDAQLTTIRPAINFPEGANKLGARSKLRSKSKPGTLASSAPHAVRHSGARPAIESTDINTETNTADSKGGVLVWVILISALAGAAIWYYLNTM
ncbi:MAG: pSer/pThr/pTyr-binding forkhead associated (FHA) protein [Lentisphaeria bacterium]|jgi:pSer/pThr/pTyr-binding forkhead associated (FHA) protein